MSQYMEAWTSSWLFAAYIFNTMAADTLDLYITGSSEALNVLTFAIHNSLSSTRISPTCIISSVLNDTKWNIFSSFLKISHPLKG